MPRLQTSMVFSQRTWPGAGDIDDCWVVADLQALNAVAPWLELVSVPLYRDAAGRPDVQGQPDGGQLAHTVRAVRELWPAYGARVVARSGVSWTTILEKLNDGRPVSLSIVNGELPARLQHGYTGPTSFHRVCIARTPGDRTLIANPLADAYDRWQECDPDVLRTAAYAYGQAKVGRKVAYGVTFPTLDEALAVYHPDTVVPPGPDPTPYDQGDLNLAYGAGVDAAAAAVGSVSRIPPA